MSISRPDDVLWMTSVAGELLLLAILLKRRLYRTFPVFAAYLLWQLVSDFLLMGFLRGGHYNKFTFAYFYYSFLAIADLLELGVLLEIAANVLAPARPSLKRKLLYALVGAVISIGVCAFGLAAVANVSTAKYARAFPIMDTAAAILRLSIFLLLAGFAQVLGLSWKNHVFQLTSGLAFYSVVLLVAQLAQSRVVPGIHFHSEYHFWGEIEVIGYLCTLYFWCYAFVKKEAPRKEFSPQMARILVSLSGNTKRQRAVLARTRDELQ